MGAETSTINELTEIRGFIESGLVRSWVDGSKERVWILSLRIPIPFHPSSHDHAGLAPYFPFHSKAFKKHFLYKNCRIS